MRLFIRLLRCGSTFRGSSACAEIVEDDRRQGPIGHFAGQPVPQESEPGARVGLSEAFLLGRLDRMHDVGAGRHTHRGDRGEPADRSRQVGADRAGSGGQHLLVPAVALDEDGESIVGPTGPVGLPRADSTGEGTEECVVHVTAERFGHRGDQRFGQLRINMVHKGNRGVLPVPIAIDRGEPGVFGQPGEPVRLRGTIGADRHAGTEHAHPGPLGGADGPQMVGVPRAALGPGHDQVLDDRLPGHRVHTEVVDHHHDAAGSGGVRDERRADQPTDGRIELCGGRGVSTDQVRIETLCVHGEFGGQRGHRGYSVESGARGQLIPDRGREFEPGGEHRVVIDDHSEHFGECFDAQPIGCGEDGRLVEVGEILRRR